VWDTKEGVLFGPKREELRAGLIKLPNEAFHDLDYSPDIIRVIKARRIRWAGHVESMGEKRNACKALVGKTEGKRPSGRSRRK
jgi:hypothetical protein